MRTPKSKSSKRIGAAKKYVPTVTATDLSKKRETRASSARLAKGDKPFTKNLTEKVQSRITYPSGRTFTKTRIDVPGTGFSRTKYRSTSPKIPK